MMGVIGNADATVVGVVPGFEVSGEKRLGRGELLCALAEGENTARKRGRRDESFMIAARLRS
jgi:hypothetical protein